MAKASKSDTTRAAFPSKSTPAGAGETMYVVEDTAPPYVAGRRVVPGQDIPLSETAARHEVMAGHIRAKANPRKTPSQADGEAASKDV